ERKRITSLPPCHAEHSHHTVSIRIHTEPAAPVPLNDIPRPPEDWSHDGPECICRVTSTP
ncbi:hypothetical protein JMJ77_0004596, partial [Colletotrichum scovillei]